jgi:hypothetical protein
LRPHLYGLQPLSLILSLLGLPPFVLIHFLPQYLLQTPAQGSSRKQLRGRRGCNSLLKLASEGVPG